MVIRRMSQRTADRPQMTALRKHRQVFANLNPRGFCGDRLKLAPDIVRCFRLHIEAVVLTETAREKDVDDRFCGLIPAISRDVSSLKGLHVIHSQAQQADPTRLNRSATADLGMSEFRNMG